MDVDSTRADMALHKPRVHTISEPIAIGSVYEEIYNQQIFYILYSINFLSSIGIVILLVAMKLLILQNY